MTTEKQVAANRENAMRSTGPRSESGKRRSRINAFRHGLTAETVINILEDCADYEALAAAINADYRPRTNFELELTARLVSLLWRLRRAVAIESGALSIEAKRLHNRGTRRNSRPNDTVSPLYAVIPTLMPKIAPAFPSNGEPVDRTNSSKKSEMASAFMRLSDRSDAFERLGRYETRLWRQTAQTILLLNSISAESGPAGDNKYPHFGDVSLTKRRRFLWPPFVMP